MRKEKGKKKEWKVRTPKINNDKPKEKKKKNE
jgi:hypothetical protein